MAWLQVHQTLKDHRKLFDAADQLEVEPPHMMGLLVSFWLWVLGFENGVHVLVEVGTSNFVSLPRWYVLGADGTAVIQDFGRDGKMVCATGINEGDVVPVITAAGLTKTMAPRREDTIRTEDLPWADSDIRDFYRNVMAVIEGKAESRIKLDEVARVMRLMEAIFESAEKKQVIKFEA